jgi:hypothetical protein
MYICIYRLIIYNTNNKCKSTNLLALLRWFAILWIGFIDIGLATHDLSTPKRLMVCTVPGRKGGSSCRKVRDSSWGLPMAQYYYWPFQKLRNIFCNILYMIHGFASGAGAFKTKRVGGADLTWELYGKHPWYGRGSGIPMDPHESCHANRIYSSISWGIRAILEPFPYLGGLWKRKEDI